MRLSYSELQASYRVLSSFRLPHHAGSLVRGILGRALRLSSCTASSNGAPACGSTCAQPQTCTYSVLFDPPRPPNPPHRLLRGATQAPPPLLPLLPAPGAVELAAGDNFTLALRVLGRLDPPHEHHLVSALERIPALELGLGRDAGRLELDAVSFLGARNRWASPPPSATSSATSSAISPAPAPPHAATLTFETPAWIEHDKRLPLTPDFRTLFRALDRRITSVCALYGELEPDQDARFRELDTLADSITVTPSLHPVRWERHSLDRDERHPMKGLLGSVTLTGELAPFVPTLHLATITHVGKATSHGLGRLGLTLA